MTRNTPTPEGREAGAELARLIATAAPEHYARFPDDPDLCKSCAFRAGTQPNGCPSTVMDALKCVMEMSPFMCHEQPDPQAEDARPCMGWAIAMCSLGPDARPVDAPWEFSGGVEPTEEPKP